MIPLFAYYATSFWHNRVFAFARFTKLDSPEIAIVAINFNDVPSIFFIDYTPLRKICSTGKIIYRVSDLINPANNPQYYAPEEFFQSKGFVQLPAYTTLCWGIHLQDPNPEAEKILFEQSMERLERNLHNNVDPSNTLIYSIISNGLSSPDAFVKAIKTITDKNLPNTENNLPRLLQQIFYFESNREGNSPAHFLSFLEILQKSEIEIGSIVSKIIEKNNLVKLIIDIFFFWKF